MIKVILLDSDDDSYKTTKNVVNNFKNYYYDLNLLRYRDINHDLLKEVSNLDNRKIYIIATDSNRNYLDVFKLIRKHDWDSAIILIGQNDSIHHKHCDGVYQIFDCIIKNDNFAETLRANIELIINHSHEFEKFVYQSNTGELGIHTKNILYVYRDTVERKAVIVTKHNSYHVYLTLKDIKSMLGDSFCQCHRACLVNMNRVEFFDWKNKSFILDNGQIVNLLSKKYKDEIEEYIF